MQFGHSPHELYDSTTWSPGCTWATPAPTSSTTPAPSWPRTAGSGTGTIWSRMTWSVWQTPGATTRTSTSPGPGASSSSSRISNGALVAGTTAAVICMGASSTVGRQGRGGVTQPGSYYASPDWMMHNLVTTTD